MINRIKNTTITIKTMYPKQNIFKISSIKNDPKSMMYQNVSKISILA